MTTTMIRQGDVLLIRRDIIATAGDPLPASNGRYVLAEGEATGHAHTVDAEDAALIAEGERMLLTVHRDTTLRHQEHAAIPLSPGVYEVRRQRELTETQRDWRYVAD